VIGIPAGLQIEGTSVSEQLGEQSGRSEFVVEESPDPDELADLQESTKFTRVG